MTATSERQYQSLRVTLSRPSGKCRVSSTPARPTSDAVTTPNTGPTDVRIFSPIAITAHASAQAARVITTITGTM